MAQSLYQRGFSWKQVHTDLKVAALHAAAASTIPSRLPRLPQQILAGTAADSECLNQQSSPTLETAHIVLVDDPVQEVETITKSFTRCCTAVPSPIHGAVLCLASRQAKRSLNN